MKTTNCTSAIVRIGVFYDGTYVARVSDHYLYGHPRQARLAIAGLQAYARMKIAQREGVDERKCHVIDAHYFRGRLSARQALEQNTLFGERQFDDVLIREGVTMHYLPISVDREGEKFEKGVDVWFALEAFELALHKQFDVVVLVTGDADFVPLARKLNTLGTRVMLLAWDFESVRNGKKYSTHTARTLVNAVDYPVMMDQEIDQAQPEGSRGERAVARLFVPPGCAPQTQDTDGPMPLSQLQRGKLSTLIASRGFGFIEHASGEPLYFHASALRGCTMEALHPGQAVSFRTAPSARGIDACEVQLLTQKATA